MSEWDGSPLVIELLDGVASDLLGKGYDLNSPKFKFQIQAVIIRYFLGDEWFQRHCGLGAIPNFLKPNFNGDEPDWDYSFNLLMLAELLFNLQDVPGFSGCISKMRGDQTESAFAELEVGAVIKKAGLSFSYVDPNLDPRRTYDLEIQTPHGRACGEIKCKSSATLPTPEKVADAFKKARKQLPGDAAGIIFIKLPPDWVEVQSAVIGSPARIRIPQGIADAVESALTQTKRVKRLVYYVVSKSADPHVGLAVTTYTAERANPKNASGSPWNLETFRPDPRAKWLGVLEINERWANVA
jgi:hypothetical protein